MNMTFTRPFARSLLFLLALAVPVHVRAISGVADTVIITGDLTDGMKWERELLKWQESIAALNRQIERTDALIRLVGDPQEMAKQLIDSVPTLMAPIDDAIGLQTRVEALKTADSLYHLKSVAVKTYKDANSISDKYQAFGEMVERDKSRYAHFVLQEAMNARYKQAVEKAEAVEKREMDVQRKALGQLQNARTETEIGLLNGVIAASKQRLDLAHAKAAQAKAELDAFRGQLGFEDERKAEADREWAQGVVTRLRERALRAYQAQVGPGGDAAGG